VSSLYPPAKFVQGVPGRNVLYVVYGVGVGENEVRPVVRQLSALRGVQARTVRGSLDDPRGPKTVVIELTIQPGANRVEVMGLLKRLARPELPIAIDLIRVGLLICRCDYLSTRLDRLEFYSGLGPPDVEAFRLRYYAAMQALPVARLFSDEPQPPYKLLTDGIEAALAGLGARATQVYIAPRRDTRPCTHPR
jgi:hypothetical protein